MKIVLTHLRAGIPSPVMISSPAIYLAKLVLDLFQDAFLILVEALPRSVVMT